MQRGVEVQAEALCELAVSVRLLRSAHKAEASERRRTKGRKGGQTGRTTQPKGYITIIIIFVVFFLLFLPPSPPSSHHLCFSSLSLYPPRLILIRSFSFSPRITPTQ